MLSTRDLESIRLRHYENKGMPFKMVKNTNDPFYIKLAHKQMLSQRECLPLFLKTNSVPCAMDDTSLTQISGRMFYNSSCVSFYLVIFRGIFVF